MNRNDLITLNFFRLFFEDQTHFMTARLNFSKATNSGDLQKFIESNVVHRQGFTYGAPLGKKFCLFIDDLQASVNANGSDKFRNAPEVKQCWRRSIKFSSLNFFSF